MRFLTVLVVATCLLGPAPAHGVAPSQTSARRDARVTGTYVVTSTARSEVTSVFDTAGSATWTFDAKPSQRVLPAMLTQAAYGPFVSPCSENGDGTVTDNVVGPGGDPSAELEFGIVADLLRDRTRATLKVKESGYARWVTDRECTGVYAGGNGVTSQDVFAATMFPNGTVGYDRWPMRLDSSGHWHIDGVQTESAGAGDGSSRAEVHAVLQGSLRDFHAVCTIPTVKQMRKVKSFKQGAAMLARAGFGRPYTGVRHIRWAPRGHFYVDELGDTPLDLCGARLHLYRS